MTPERVARIREVLNNRQPDLTVITDNVHKPHNISAIVRSCDAFAVPEVHVIWPEEQYRVFHGRAAGSKHWVRVKTHKDVLQGIQHLKERGFRVLAAHLSEQAVSHYEQDLTQATAILLGTERYGISEAAAATVDGHIMVPMAGMVESLNVSVAAALILSEACRQRHQAGMFGRNRLDPELYKQLFFEWCYPDLAEKCQIKKLPYPELDEEGNFIDPAAFSAAYNAK